MKVIYDDVEKERLQEVYKHDTFFKLFAESDPDRIYGISFKVTNPSLAQYILVSLMHNQLEEFDLGIDITAIHFSQLQDKSEIKEKLHKMIDEIID